MRVRPSLLSITVALTLGGIVCAALLIKGRSPYRTTAPTPTALTRSSTSSHAVSNTADQAIASAEAQIARDPQKAEGYLALATAYMRKVREAGDPGYYLRAETAVRRALKQQPDSYEGLRTLVWIQTGKHEFREALAAAEHLRSQRPDDYHVYGLLGDVYAELGEYDRATQAFQQMADLRPSLASYSRAAYMRELLGDPQGATELMTLAVKSGSSRDPEPLAWSLVQLGNLYFSQGNITAADTAYQQALTVFPQYYQALAALGRVRGAQRRYSDAIELYRQAVAIVPAPDTVATFGDLLASTGKADEAEKQYALVEYIEQVNELNQIAYTRQLALFYADHNRKLDEALKLAEAELERRHDIYSYDTLAWVYYKSRRFADAEKAMTQALRLGTQDALLFFHAGMIAHAQGNMQKAKDFLQRALTLNSHFSLSGAEVARSTLAEMEKQALSR